MEDEEVAMVDGVFEGAFGALGDETWFRSGSFSGCHRVGISLRLDEMAEMEKEDVREESEGYESDGEKMRADDEERR
ncbi:hypothetical protein Tco_1213251 [Tanacetum coccineum]